MIDGVEFRYLDVKWINQDTVKSLEISEYEIPLDEHDDHYLIETFTYQKYFPKIAIYITSELALHKPYVKNSLGKKIEFLPIEDPTTHKIWWIHSDGWDSEKKYYRSELFRTVGSVDLIVQNESIKLNNNSASLTVEDLEEYLQDFKHDLWQIILNPKSSIKGTISKKNSMISEESLHLLKDFADALEAILKKPAVELKETQEQKPIKAVRPVNLTFREIATKGFRKQHTSRGYLESLDTPDNRYLNYCSSRVWYIAKQLSLILDKQESYLQRIIECNTRTIDNNVKCTTKKVPRSVFDDEVKRIQQKLDEQTQFISNALSHQQSCVNETHNYEYVTYELVLSQSFNKLCGYYFVNKVNGKATKEIMSFKGSYVVVGMQESIFSLIESQKGGRSFFNLTFKGYVQKGWDTTTTPQKPYYYIFFHHIEDIIFPQQLEIRKELEERAVRRKNYEKTGWEVRLTSEDRAELIRESNFVSQKNKLLEEHLFSNNDILKKISPTLLRLKKIKRFFKDNKVKRSAVFPSTMSFVQNPSYAKAKSSFKKINQLDGMDGELFNSLFEFDQIGIINIPILYERWCLLQIIKLLSEIFGFYLNGDWQNMLIQSVIQNQYNIEFEFHNPINDRKIILGYEKTLNNGNRPDFVLDLLYQGYVFKQPDLEGNGRSQPSDSITNNIVKYEEYSGRNINLDSQSSAFDNWLQGGVQKKRFVMDAKFKDNLFQKGFDLILDELINDKNYDEDGRNKVFLIHPQKAAIQERTSPLDWGIHSDYGQNSEHSKGFIFLLPSSKQGNTLDNLQRLLGMFLQSTSHFIDYGESKFWSDTLCISCGASSHEDLMCTKHKTKGGKNSWRVTCKKCSHLSVKTVCYLCSKDLYKNQFNLTYHRTRAEQVSNIVCPSCQEFLN